MSFQSRYKQLNDQQRLAVDTIDGPVMVVAGPGSGKTELLGMRVANILLQADVYPRNILCLTFTDAAAKNMRERLAGLIGSDANKVAIHTFHTFALSVMAQHREAFYDGIGRRTADDILKIDIVGEILASLPLHDALSKKDIQGQFVYLHSVIDRIGKLKRAAITPQMFTDFLQENKRHITHIESHIVSLFEARISKSTLAQIPELLATLDDDAVPSSLPHMTIPSYVRLLRQSLQEAYDVAVEEGKTRAISAWKKEWLVRHTETKVLSLKDLHQLERNFTLAQVYEQYQQALAQQEVVDFEDMIMDTLEVLRTKPGVLASIQEQYQYVMVDEFQDTNDAQMNLLQLLLDNPANEGKPNVLVVGDDDQAIYKFQGAEINNILQFTAHYPETSIITLVKNYRSTPDIVSFAQQVIVQGDDRLVNRMEHIDKELEAANPKVDPGLIVVHGAQTIEEEYTYVTKEIETLRQEQPHASIAVIARNHRFLSGIVPHFQQAQLPISYEYQRNVLEDPMIQDLVNLMHLIESIGSENIYHANELFPTVLLAPYWNLDRAAVWQLSVDAHNNTDTSRWLDCMLASDNKEIKGIADWLITQAGLSQTHSLEQMLDELIGNHRRVDVVSPFRAYYFSDELRQEQAEVYIRRLSALKTLIEAARSHATAYDFPRLSTLLTCVETYDSHGVSLLDKGLYEGGGQAITLLTAHKAKGLEFDAVFVLTCQDDVWAKAQRSNLIAFPKNLPIDPAGENQDDFLRLFFVAITRAKKHVYLTHHTQKQNGKATTQLSYLAAPIAEQGITQGSDTGEANQKIEALEANLFTPPMLSQTEKELLTPLLEKYVMSVTHLNNFLDVTKGGPAYFLESNVLRFPQGKPAVMLYGVAMHSAMERIYGMLHSTSSVPTVSEGVEIVIAELEKQPFSSQEFAQYKEKGERVISWYLTKHAHEIDSSHWIEVNFRQQQVMIDGMQITGKIDKIVPLSDTEVAVYDYKTGKAKYSWTGRSDTEKIQLHNYKRQLAFYKLLLEESRDYQQYTVTTGVLEFLSKGETDVLTRLSHTITDEEVARVRQLIVSVSSCIRNGEFPDTSSYDSSIKGIFEFEEYLLQL